MSYTNLYSLVGKLALILSLIASAATIYLMFKVKPNERYTLLVTAMLWVAVGTLSYIVSNIESRKSYVGSEGFQKNLLSS